jgi:hypothetical protein
MSINSLNSERSLNYSWIPDKSSDIKSSYCIDLSKSYRPEKIPLIIEKEISENDNIIYIYIVSGQTLKISIDKSEKLIHLKKWILDCFHIYSDTNDYFLKTYACINDCDDNDFLMDYDYYYYYMIDLFNDNIPKIPDTLGYNILDLNIEDIIDNQLTCVIYEKEKNIMICAQCTSEEHMFYNYSQSWNVVCAGNVCDRDCGLLYPYGLNIYDLPENIPSEYKCYFYDIDWFNFKRKIEYYLNDYKYYKQLSATDIKKLKGTSKRYSDNDSYSDCEDIYDREFRLTDEQKHFIFIQSCFNDYFS